VTKLEQARRSEAMDFFPIANERMRCRACGIVGDRNLDLQLQHYRSLKCRVLAQVYKQFPAMSEHLTVIGREISRTERSQ